VKHLIPELPGPVSAHVTAKITATDWATLLHDMRTLCAGCPAEGDPEICISCPLEGMATAAATLTLKARLLKIEAKSQKRKTMKTTIDRGGKK
jgi:hypothetical protein